MEICKQMLVRLMHKKLVSSRHVELKHANLQSIVQSYKLDCYLRLNIPVAASNLEEIVYQQENDRDCVPMVEKKHK
jgi:hypothetical protein